MLPPAGRDTALRLVATNDLGVTFVPVPTSFGLSGTCAGIVELLEQERERQPTLWLDAGDFTFGPVLPLLGRRPWAEVAALPIAAAAAGNHDFDDGAGALREAAALLPFPILCADADAGLAPSALLDTAAGPVGVVGLTTPALDLLAAEADAGRGPPERVAELAAELRREGARWVVGIQHEGAAWWPTGASTAARPDRWARVAAPLAEVVDVLLGGHVLGAWCGDLHGTPAGHAFAFESSVLVVDLPASRDRPVVRGCFRVPPRAPEEASPATEVVVQAAERIVGRLESRWLGRPDAVDYLPDRIADALRRATGADAALVFGGQHATQAPLDGAVAALGPGPVSELDLFRLFPYDDDRPVVVELRPEELAAAVRAHDAVTDPDNRDGDHVWWNSIRMRAGVSATGPTPASVAVMPFILGRLGELLGRELAGEPAATGGRQAVLRALS